jgi:NAD+ synthase (glutamine-hydrolysing)
MPELSKYGFIRVGSCSPEMKVADTVLNTQKIIEAIAEASENDCSLLVFPELCITGYTCGDLFYQKKLQNAALDGLLNIKEATELHQSTAIVGLPIFNRGRLFNCASVVSHGEIKGIVPKTFLCNTKEYYEERWFSSENDRYTDTVVIDGEEIHFAANTLFILEDQPDCIFGIEICEDLWSLIPPSLSLAGAGANIIFNLSASNEYLGKHQYREQLVLSHSARTLSAYVYSSSGAGESSTDLSFSGHCIIAENGNKMAETELFGFDTKICYADIDYERLNIERTLNNSFSGSTPVIYFHSAYIPHISSSVSELKRHYEKTPFVPVRDDIRAETCKTIFNIQTQGLARRLKHINSDSLTIGVSGGLDSTLALMVCIKTFELLGYEKKKVNAISMPGFGTTKRTKSNAEKLSVLLGVTFREISISKSTQEHFKDIGHDPKNKDVVYENAQARERTKILMDIANQTGGIVIGTGDLSELALGWCTYNADQMSMYGVNSGVPKTLVKYIISWLAEEVYDGETSKVLRDIAETPISPELLPPDDKGEIAQKTEDNIGPYILHDFFLYYAIRSHFSPSKVYFLAKQAFGNDFDNNEILKWLKVFYARFFSQQFKRSCMPDGIKVGTISLSPRGDWRMPSDASAAIWLKELESL